MKITRVQKGLYVATIENVVFIFQKNYKKDYWDIFLGVDESWIGKRYYLSDCKRYAQKWANGEL